MTSFIQFLTKISRLSETAIREIEKVTQKETHLKKQILIEDLARCEYLYFIESGLVRAIFYHNGKEITDWFGMENMIIGPIIRHFPVKDTKYSVEILESTIVYKVSFSQLEVLYQNFHEVERLGRIIAIISMLHLQKKLDNLQLLSAKERYEQFLYDYPNLIQRVPLGMIASYLNMNQVTLSRIRHER